MNIKENMIISYKKTFRNKKNIYHCITVSFCVIVLISIFIFNKNVSNFINASENSNIEFRTISIPPKNYEEDFGLSEIQNIKHIDFVYNSLYSRVTIDSNLKTNKVDGMINLKVTSDRYLEQIVGKKILTNTDSGNIICPKNFYPDSNAIDLKINEKEMLNGDNLIGKNITVNYFTRKLEGSIIIRDEEIEQKFKVIGTFDSETIMEPNNTCFISYNDMKNLLDKKILKEVNKNSYYWYAIVDDVHNVDKVKQELSNHNFGILNNETKIDDEQVDLINNILAFITILTIIALITITILYSNKKLELESYNIGVLRALGYKKKEISKSYLIEECVTNIITLLIGTIFTIILFYVLYFSILKNFNYIGFTVKLDFMSFIYSYLIIILTNFISSYIVINRKIKKNIIKLIGDKA